MKSKLSLLSDNTIVLAENYERCIRLYYSDGHYEILNESIQSYIRSMKIKKGYKNPIIIESTELFPTVNIRYEDCLWVNLDYLDQGDSLYFSLLKQKEVLNKVINMYVNYKRRKIIEI